MVLKKRFSIRYKLIIIFGLLVLSTSVILSLLALRSARKAVTEKVETHLIDKANDTAKIIDGYVNAFIRFVEGLARTPSLRDNSLSFTQKVQSLVKNAEFNELIDFFAVCDLHGRQYDPSGRYREIKGSDWFQAAVHGTNFIAAPRISRDTNKLQIIVAVPIKDDSNAIIGVLSVAIPGALLSQDINNITVGKTGNCYIVSNNGVIVANQDLDLVKSQANIIEQAKTDKTLASIAAFLEHVLNADESEIGYYTYKDETYIASFATMKTTDWSVIIRAPVNEFMGTVNILRFSLIGLTGLILVVAFVIIYFVARAFIKPIQNAVDALRDISQGEGDLTVRLPVRGNDEITDMSEYFNETIAKIGRSIKTVGENSGAMEAVGNELASNMTQTASSVHKISTNIDGVKQQALTQAASVSETAATIEEIVRTIKQLNGSIEVQAASVAQSSASVEEMVANIVAVSQTLEQTDNVIRTLADATADGKGTVVNANTVTQRSPKNRGVCWKRRALSRTSQTRRTCSR